MKTPYPTPNPPIPPLLTVALVGRTVEIERLDGRVVTGLLAYLNTSTRYVSLRNGAGPMFSHEDFERIEWSDVRQVTVIAPSGVS